MKHTVALAGLALLLAATPVLAQDADRRALLAGALFGRVDADGDGRITRDELTGARRTGFARADANADGVLSAAEIAARQDRARRLMQITEAGTLDRIAAMDTDGDGNLTFEEFDRKAPVFDLLDADGDGAVSRAEFDRARAAFMQ